MKTEYLLQCVQILGESDVENPEDKIKIETCESYIDHAYDLYVEKCTLNESECISKPEFYAKLFTLDEGIVKKVLKGAAIAGGAAAAGYGAAKVGKTVSNYRNNEANNVDGKKASIGQAFKGISGGNADASLKDKLKTAKTNISNTKLGNPEGTGVVNKVANTADNVAGKVNQTAQKVKDAAIAKKNEINAKLAENKAKKEQKTENGGTSVQQQTAENQSNGANAAAEDSKNKAEAKQEQEKQKENQPPAGTNLAKVDKTTATNNALNNSTSVTNESFDPFISIQNRASFYKNN